MPIAARRQLARIDIDAHRVLLRRRRRCTCATPLTIEIRWATCDCGVLVERRRAAASASSATRKRIGWSAGLTFWYDGGDGISGGSCRAALRDHRLHVLGGGVDVAVEVELERDVRAAERAGGGHRVEAGDRRELLLERRRDRPTPSSPGWRRAALALTWIVGKSTFGRSLTGSSRYAITPKTGMPSMTSVVVTGRLMKSSATDS